MRSRTTAATAALLLAALTACGGSGDSSGSGDSKTDDKPAAQPKSEKKEDAFDCMAEDVSQADWMEHCSDEGAGTGGDGTTGTETLAWGKTAKTVGAQSPADGGAGGGTLEVTPSTVVYQKEAMSNKAANGTYAIIAVKDRAPEGAAAESAPAEGGGWQWVAPDGQALDDGDNDAGGITPDGFTGGGSIPGGAHKWDTVAFDLSEAQANGGTLVYTDGAGARYRWKVPAKDSGPEVAKLKKGLEGH